MQTSLILITLTFVVKEKFTTKWIKSDYNLWNILKNDQRDKLGMNKTARRSQLLCE